MTFQVMTNGNPELAKHIANDMGKTAWRMRDELLNGTRVCGMTEGVKLAKDALAKGAAPIVLADHSDRSGAATSVFHRPAATSCRTSAPCSRRYSPAASV